VAVADESVLRVQALEDSEEAQSDTL